MRMTFCGINKIKSTHPPKQDLDAEIHNQVYNQAKQSVLCNQMFTYCKGYATERRGRAILESDVKIKRNISIKLDKIFRK